MKNLILILFTVLSLYSCTGWGEDNIVDCGNTTYVSYSSLDGQCNHFREEYKPKKLSFLIFNSEEEYNKVFLQCQTLIAVDFPDLTQKRILGIFAGEKTSGGYDIKIQSVVENDCQIIVEYFEKAPAYGEPVTTVITYPSDYIVLPKSNKPISFRNVKDKSETLIGIYTETSPVSGRTQLKFSKGNKVVRTESGSLTSDEYIYELLNNRIKLMPTWGNISATELDFEIINDSKFKIENLYPGIPENPKSYMTFEK